MVKENTKCYAIEKIIESRDNGRGNIEYLIKWKDFSESENSWVSVHDLFSKKKPINVSNEV